MLKDSMEVRQALVEQVQRSLANRDPQQGLHAKFPDAPDSA